MSVYLPTIKQLQYLVALHEHDHFGRAADASNVSQSTLSAGIRELESLLGVTLVERSRRVVRFTPLGNAVVAKAHRVLREAEELADLVQASGKPLAGELRMSVIPTIAPFLLPRVLPAVRQTFPQLKLFLHEDVTQKLYEQLMEGDLDLVLLALPFDLAGVERMVLFKDRFRLAARKGSKLVDPEHYRPDRLRDGSVLLLREGHCLREHAMDACRIRDTEKMSAFSASSLLTLIEMVDADLGVTFLPEMAEGSALLQNTQVATYPLSDNNYRSIGLIWRRGSPRRDEFEKLGEFLAAQHKKGDAPEARAHAPSG